MQEPAEGRQGSLDDPRGRAHSFLEQGVDQVLVQPLLELLSSPTQVLRIDALGGAVAQRSPVHGQTTGKASGWRRRCIMEQFTAMLLELGTQFVARNARTPRRG